MRITIHEVARAAGVSITTVSHVLNGGKHRDRYAEATIRRVQEVSERLGYVPSRRGRSMSTGLNRVVSIFAQLRLSQRSGYPCMVFAGAAMALREFGYTVEIVDPRIEANLRNVLANTDGVIFCVDSNQTAEEMVLQSGLPLVRLNLGYFAPLNSVEPDDPGGMQLLGAHLLSAGYQRILYVRPPDGHPSIEVRQAALADAVRGVEFEAVLFDAKKLESCFETIKRDPGRRTVLVVYGDGYRLVLSHMLVAAGLSVPHDLGLASCHTGMLDVPMDLSLKVTGMTYSVMNLGAVGARMLLERIQNKGKDVPSVLVPETLEYGMTTDTP